MQALAEESFRARLIHGFAEVVADKGYAAATIADIVRVAKVSKRTFYEHFDDKEACFLATYAYATDMVLAAVAAAFEASASSGWEEQVDAAIDAYVTALEQHPAFTRSCLVEILAAGPRALARRREVHGAFAEMLRTFAARTQKKHPELRTITPAMATALVGGVDELLLVQVERGMHHRLSSLRETASELMKAVLSSRP